MASALVSVPPTAALAPYPPTPVLTVLHDAAANLGASPRRFVGVVETDWPRSLERRTAQLLKAARCGVRDLDELLGAAGFADLDDVRRAAGSEQGLRLIPSELRVRDRPLEHRASDLATPARRPSTRTDIDTTLELEQQNLVETMRSVQASGALELAARAVLGSRHRYVFGDLKSRGYAHLFAADLSSALGHVRLVDPTGAALLAAAGDAHPRDSLTVFCFRRYSRSTVQLAAHFAAAGAAVVAITDAADSPVCQHATLVLPVVTRSDSPTHSPTAVTAVGHTLAALAIGGAKGADRRVVSKGQLAAALDIYVEDNSEERAP